MGRSKILWLVIIGVILILGGYTLFKVSQYENVGVVKEPESAGNTVPIQSEFSDKIVYGTNADLDEEALRNNCDSRGGTFNTCGSVCDKGEVCIQVCAFTCEF